MRFAIHLKNERLIIKKLIISNSIYCKRCCAVIPDLTQIQKKLRLQSCEVLALFLANYCELSFPDYFSSLPDFIDHVLYWSQSDVELLDKEIRKEYVRYYEDYQHHYKRVSKTVDIDERAFRQAWVRLNTRTIFLPTEVITNDKTDTWALAPFYDCLNHSSEANISIEITDERFQIRTNNAIATGSEGRGLK